MDVFGALLKETTQNQMLRRCSTRRRTLVVEVYRGLGTDDQIHPGWGANSYSCRQTGQLYHRITARRGCKSSRSCEKGFRYQGSRKKRGQVRPLCRRMARHLTVKEDCYAEKAYYRISVTTSPDLQYVRSIPIVE